MVRVGFSVASSSLILGESDLSVYFDSDGLFSCGKSKSPEKDARFTRDQALKLGPAAQAAEVITLVLNLDEKSPFANTVGLNNDLRAA